MQNTVDTFKRVDYLDMLKCLGMFIVVSGHIHPYYGWFSLLIHSFVIPLYFFLSGMTFKRSKYPTFGIFIKHRAKSLLLPFAMFSVITWLFWALFNVATHTGADVWPPLLQTVLAQGSGGFLVHNVPLWFLPCLFVVEVLYYLIDQMHQKYKVLVCVLLSALGACMISWWRGWSVLLPWSAESALVAVLFYGAGNMLTGRFGLQGLQDIVLSKKKLFIPILIVLTAILAFGARENGHITLGSDSLGKYPLLFYFDAFLGIITTGIFSILVCSVSRSNRVVDAVMNYHLWFGRNSLYIMSTHVPVKGIIMIIISKLISKSVYFVANDYICLSVTFVLTCGICSVLSVIIVRLKKKDELRMAGYRRNKA